MTVSRPGVLRVGDEVRIHGQLHTIDDLAGGRVRLLDVGIPVLDLLGEDGRSLHELREDIENSIRYANITIIEGTGASQYGIGAVSARLVEAVLRDERAVLPVAAYAPDFDVTLSLVSVLGACGVVQMYQPPMTQEERDALDRSVSTLREATRRAVDIVEQQPAPGPC